MNSRLMRGVLLVIILSIVLVGTVPVLAEGAVPVEKGSKVANMSSWEQRVALFEWPWADNDGDGFTNQEERECKTLPNDKNSKPTSKDASCIVVAEQNMKAEYTHKGGMFLGPAFGAAGSALGMQGMELFSTILFSILCGIIFYEMAKKAFGGGI